MARPKLSREKKSMYLLPIRIEHDKASLFKAMVSVEQKSMNQKVRELIDVYIKKNSHVITINKPEKAGKLTS